MKLRMLRQAALVLAGAAILWMAGCSSSSPNETIVTVSPSATTVLAGQSTSLTATVNGPATVLTVTWKCTWTTTVSTTDSTGKVTTTTATGGCDPTSTDYPKYGTVSDETQNVLTYTAPPLSSYPQPAPVITLTATSTAEKNKNGLGTVGLDSGIRASITPSTATVPVGLNPAATTKFTASFLNDNGVDATWLVTQPVRRFHWQSHGKLQFARRAVPVAERSIRMACSPRLPRSRRIRSRSPARQRRPIRQP